MKSAEIRTKAKKELLAQCEEMRESLWNLKMKSKAGEMKETANLRKTRRDIARILTILKEKEKDSKNART